MPFGLTNAPSTFQATMNSIFKPFLHKCILVFFNNILIYSKDWSSHLQHLILVLQTLKDNSLFAKLTKYEFVVQRMNYLCNVINQHGVLDDQDKIRVIVNWPKTSIVTQLRGFFCLQAIIGDLFVIMLP